MDELIRNFLRSTVDTAVQAGITSLITDVDFKDAFKGQAALNLAETVLGGKSPLDLFKPKTAQPAGQPAAGATGVDTSALQGPQSATPQDLIAKTFNRGTAAGRRAPQSIAEGFGPSFNAAANNAQQNVFQSKLTPVSQADTRGFLESLGDVVSGDGGRMAALKQAFMPDPSGDPDMLRKYGPLFGAGIAGLYAAGAFDPVEQQQIQQFGGLTGQDLLRQNPGGYRIGVPAIARGYAKGGDIDPSTFPRRTGGISGPGTGTSDDIPAMLSDGEFVMTAKAVRGAGNGDRGQGIRNMYQMMNGFESRMA